MASSSKSSLPCGGCLESKVAYGRPVHPVWLPSCVRHVRLRQHATDLALARLNLERVRLASLVIEHLARHPIKHMFQVLALTDKLTLKSADGEPLESISRVLRCCADQSTKTLELDVDERTFACLPQLDAIAKLPLLQCRRTARPEQVRSLSCSVRSLDSWTWTFTNLPERHGNVRPHGIES